MPEAREEAKPDETVNVKEKFGGDKAKTMPAAGDGAGKGGAGGEGGGQRGGRGNPDIMSFDKDGDKKVSKDEAPERMKEFFDTIDTSGDGFIDAKEAGAASPPHAADAPRGWRRSRRRWRSPRRILTSQLEFGLGFKNVADPPAGTQELIAA